MAKLTVQKQLKLPLIDNPFAPDLFADDAVGFLVTNNMIRITFASAKVDHTKNPVTHSRVVTGRLVMPVAAAESLNKLLTAVIENARSQQAANTGAHTLQ